MIHCFSVEVAEKYGINCAVVLHNIEMWVKHNEANDRNFHDGYYWTYNSTKAFKELFPYLSQRQIETALKKLRDEEIIITANYNEMKYDRTLWYAITEKGKSILHGCEMDLTQKGNGFDTDVEPIPYINTNINHIKTESIPYSENPNMDSLTETFEKLWSLYPKKIGKKDILKSKKKLKAIEERREDIERAIENYKDRIQKDRIEDRYILNGSTFFNGRWEDYLNIEEVSVYGRIEGITYL